MIRLEFANNNYALIALLALGSVIATLYFYRKVLADNWRSWLIVLPVLRLAAISILLLVLADAVVIWSSSKPPIVTLICDQSPSMALNDIADNDSSIKKRLEWSSAVLMRELSGKSFRVNSATLNEQSPVQIDKEQSDAFVFVTDGYPSPNIDQVSLIIQSTNKPVYCALVPKQKLTPDVGIDRVEAPRVFSAGIPVFFTVAVHGLNAQGSETLLTISDAAGVLASRRVKFISNDDVQTIALPVTEPIVGVSNFQVKTALLNNEVNTANNEYGLSAMVEERVTRILLFESQPSWEAKFFRRAFDNNASVHVDYFVQVSRAATVAQPADSSVITELHQILGNRAQLFSYDGIAVGATDGTFLNANESRNIRDFVDTRGGGLVILGSNNYSGSIVTPSSPLAALLPATVDAKTLIGERTISTSVAPPAARAVNNQLFLTSEGERSPALSLLQSNDSGTSPIDKTAFGDSFIRVNAVRPAARVLAELRGPSKQTYPAIIAGDYGDGRVILLTQNDLYKSSFSPDSGESFMAKLWQGVTYYAAARGKPPIYCQTISTNGKSSEIEMIVRDSEYKEATVDQISATLIKTSTNRTTTPIFLRADNNAVGRFTTTVENPINSSAMLEVTGTSAKHRFNYQMLLNEKDKSRPYRLIPDNTEKLAILFQPVNIIQVEDGRALADKLESTLPKAKVSESRYGLIDHYLPLFLVPLLLSLEFFLRRKGGIE